MKPTKRLVATLFILGSIISSYSQTAATLTSLGATAPTPGTLDVAQMSTSGNTNHPDGLNYYTDNQSDHSSGEPGETFTTGTNSAGYLLSSLALKTAGLGSSSGTGTAKPYYLHIYSVSGGNVTLLQTYISGNVAFNDGDWLAWTGLSVPLNSNSVYAWSFGKVNSGGGWDDLSVASGNLYSGGEIALTPPAGGAMTFGSSHNYDATFDAGLSLPGPAQPPVVTNLPASGVQATGAMLNGQIVSTGGNVPTVTIYYGSTDGSTNAGSWEHSVFMGAQSGTFGLTLPGLSPNSTYFFTAFATNSAGSAWAAPSKSFTTATSSPVPVFVSVVTYHNDNTRDGANTNETVLSPATVNAGGFGRLFSYPVDGQVYAEPLVVTNVTIPGQGVHNVVFVATEHDTVFAFDADGNFGTNGGLLWSTNLGPSAAMPNNDFGNRYGAYHDLTPEMGITGTPVIDPVSKTLYVDAFTHDGTNLYHHRIHALDITTGHEQPYSPVIVAASVPGRGVDSSNSNVTFNAEQQLQRPGLTLANGKLYVAYGSFADTDPYHGWILGFNATNLTLASTNVFNTSPNATVADFGANAGEASIWMGGDGLCADTNFNLYFETGNGSFSQNTNGGDYGDCFVKVSTTNGLKAADYFAPYNQASLQSSDADLGSGGPVLLPDNAGNATHPHLLVGAGKEGKIYLLDRDNLGQYNSASDSQIVEELPGAIGELFGAPAYFNHLIFYQGIGDVMKAFSVSNANIAATPVSQSSVNFGFPGATPAISANGNAGAIAWAIQADAYSSGGPSVLHAYNATNLAQELYNSSQNLSRDNPGPAVKMTVPTVAGGKVYMGADHQLSVFGTGLFLTAPVISPSGGSFTNSATVALAGEPAGVNIYYTTNGTTPTTSSTLYTGPFVITNSALVQAIAVASGAANSGVAAASLVNSSAIGNGIGLLGAYYANHTSATPYTGTPTLVRTDSVVNFNWNSVGPDPSVGQTTFTVRWTGTIQPQFNETYTFYATADDGVRLWINGQEIVNEWIDQAPTTYQASLPLAAQQLYNIEMDYYQGGGGAEAMLAWSSQSTPQAIIPQTQLYTYTNPPPSVTLTAPTNNSSYTAGGSVTISATATAPYNLISKVDFYAGATYLGSVSNAPYTVTATGLAAGSYALTAVATDGSGLSSTSAPVNLTMTAGSGQPYGLNARGTAPAFFNMPTTFAGTIPTLLSQTGVFSNTPAMTPVAGLIPYAPNTPLWSDGALKQRYFSVPNNGGAITPGQQIAFVATNSWTFPTGTVFVKTFSLQTNASDPNSILRLETRLLVRDTNGAVYGVTYKWRPDNSDADLLTTSLSQAVVMTSGFGTWTQIWYYPSPSDCLQCHTPAAHYVLGVNSRQLNGNFTYASTGVTDNQLRALNHLGIFNAAFNEAAIPGFEKLSSLTNSSVSFQERARSYLDANCAQCHQPGGGGPTFDARYDTPLASQNIINATVHANLGYDNAHVVTPDDVWRSILYDRINTTNPAIKMPPLARNLIDSNAVAVFAAWINSLPGTPALAPPAIVPNGGTFSVSVSVALQAPDTNAVVYYTLDGSLPNTGSRLYSAPFILTSNAVVSANAFETGSNNSVASAASFVIVPAPFLTAPAISVNGQFQFWLSGIAGDTYVLQGSTNLINWIPLNTNLASTNLFEVFDPNATNFNRRFYRILQQ